MRMRWVVVLLACWVAQGEVDLRLKVLDEMGQPVSGAGIRESDAKGELPYRA